MNLTAFDQRLTISRLYLILHFGSHLKLWQLPKVLNLSLYSKILNQYYPVISALEIYPRKFFKRIILFIAILPLRKTETTYMI